MDEKPAANEVSRNGLLYYIIILSLCILHIFPQHIYLFLYIFCWQENYLVVNKYTVRNGYVSKMNGLDMLYIFIIFNVEMKLLLFLKIKKENFVTRVETTVHDMTKSNNSNYRLNTDSADQSLLFFLTIS